MVIKNCQSKETIENDGLGPANKNILNNLDYILIIKELTNPIQTQL